MRRKDRKMSKEFGMKLIDKARYGVLSMIDGEKPYGIPLSIVRDNNRLYFHSAMNGRKTEIFKKNSKVSVAFVGEIKIPEVFSEKELEKIGKDSSKIESLLSDVFTTEFESVIVNGQVKFVENETEKIRAMKLICKKYTPTKMKYFNMAIKAGLNRTNVYRVEIKGISSKRKKYNLTGEEIK